MRPRVGSIRRSIVRPSVLLPQPLSPTSPNVSLAAIERETSETACTTRVAPNHPDDTSNWRTSPSTRINAGLEEAWVGVDVDWVNLLDLSVLDGSCWGLPSHVMMRLPSGGNGSAPRAQHLDSP